MSDPDLCGIVLAAGAGTRFGGPKALAHTPEGESWMHRAVESLRAGGCGRVLVALGAGAAQALPLVPTGAEPVIVEDWAEGVAAGLRASLIRAVGASAVVIVPVDTPAMPVEAITRIVAAAGATRSESLMRATYHGVAGHPVLIGKAHWAALIASARGDRGAGPYLASHAAVEVECADLWSGADIDTRPAD